MQQYVMVSGNFNQRGGMDRANYALAWYLAERVGAHVHIVSFSVDPPLVNHPRVVWHRVPNVLNSYTLSESLLGRTCRRVARSLPGARVIANGGNCIWPDVNWIHALHFSWNRRDAHAPLLFRARARYVKWAARRKERRAAESARLVIANSQRTRQELIANFDVDEQAVHTVYLGNDSILFHPPSADERRSARATLDVPADAPVIVFVGAMGWDRNKGFDTLIRAHTRLCADPNWKAILIAAGGGADVKNWRREVARLSLKKRIKLLGFTDRVQSLLAAADLMVAPSHYESYGLAMQEALCCGVPVMVSARAGIAERYPVELADMLIPDPSNVDDLIERLRRWQLRAPDYRRLTEPFGARLREYTWDDMAAQIIAVVDARGVERTTSYEQSPRGGIQSPVITK